MYNLYINSDYNSIIHDNDFIIELEEKISEVMNMLLPNKYIPEERSIIKMGGRIIHLLSSPLTVVELWDLYKEHLRENNLPPVSFDYFILTLDFLYAINTIEFVNGILRRVLHDK